MTIYDKGLLAAMKEAYKETGYTVAVIRGSMIIQTTFWGVMLNKDAVTNSIKSLIVMHNGEIPREGTAVNIQKKECSSMILEAVMATMEDLAKVYTETGGKPIKLTRITFDGLRVWQISAGYRSVAYQQQLFDNQVYAYRQDGMTHTEATAKTRQTVADPGASEHHTGLAFDVTVPGEQFSNTRQSVWLAQHCWEYGFIIRYPIDKVNITGISYEPWHVRYVGVEHSIRMRDEKLCLEEYIARYGN